MLLDFVRAFYELAPVVLQRIGVLESLPRTAAVRAVDDRQVAEEVVLKAHIL